MNASALTLPRLTSDLEDFEDMIERIENLRFGRGRRADQRLDSTGSKAAGLVDLEESKELETLGRAKKNFDEDDDDDDGLIERGPMKSQFHPRIKPYGTIDGSLIRPSSEQLLQTDVTFPLGYQRSTEIEHQRVNFGFSNTGTAANDYPEDALLELISQGVLQPAQHLSDSETDNRLHGSIGSLERDKIARFPPTDRYTRQFPVSSSYPNSNSSSPFSSSSNQSYGDAFSPTFDDILGSRFDENLESFPVPCDTFQWFEKNGNPCSSTSKSLENLDNSADTVDTIDNNYLQLVEEVIRQDLYVDEANSNRIRELNENPLENSPSESRILQVVSQSKHHRTESSKEFQTKREARIPESVASFETSGAVQGRRKPDRNIKPWPSLNLPSVKASERMKSAVQPNKVEHAMRDLLKLSLKELAEPDEDGDTMLMCLVGNPSELAKKMAYLAPLVERLSTVKDALSAVNRRGEDALYFAALNCPQYSYVTGYLAAALLQKDIDVSQRLYNTRGDTLIHLVAARGDSHAEVLAELLALKTCQGNRLFDLSKRNYDGKTALHAAVESHDPSGVVSLATVRLLLECGADPTIRETKRGDNALHMAVSLTGDPALVKVLLDEHAVHLVNAVNYNRDTALHVTATLPNNVPLERQKELFRLLIRAGGHANLPNRQGKTPLALVSLERKPLVKRIVYNKS